MLIDAQEKRDPHGLAYLKGDEKKKKIVIIHENSALLGGRYSLLAYSIKRRSFSRGIGSNNKSNGYL